MFAMPDSLYRCVLAVRPQVLGSAERHRHKPGVAGDEAAVVGVLPHGQAWARGPPGVEHLAVCVGLGRDPLEQVEDQVLSLGRDLVPLL